MRDWLYVAGMVLVAIPLVWLAIRGRRLTADLDPVSPHWLAEQKRANEDDAQA